MSRRFSFDYRLLILYNNLNLYTLIIKEPYIYVDR